MKLKPMNRSRQHLLEVSDIEQLKNCPFCNEQQTQTSNRTLQNGITWLRLQSYRLTFHLTYIDLLVVGAYILFIFSALQYTSTLSLPWLHQVTFIVLLVCCVLFIGIHLLAQKPISTKQLLHLQQIEPWQQYCSSLKRERSVLRYYTLGLILFSLVFGYAQYSRAPGLLIWLTLLGILLFSFGLYFMANTIRLKKQTECYLESVNQSTQHKVGTALPLVTE